MELAKPDPPDSGQQIIEFGLYSLTDKTVG